LLFCELWLIKQVPVIFHPNSLCINRLFCFLFFLSNSPAVKKVCSLQEGHCEKNVKSKVAAKNDCDRRLIAKILISTIQANLCCLLHVSLGFGTKFTWIVVIKIFSINLPPQPFLGRHLGFHIFFHNGLLWGSTLFLQLDCFWIRFHFFV